MVRVDVERRSGGTRGCFSRTAIICRQVCRSCGNIQIRMVSLLFVRQRCALIPSSKTAENKLDCTHFL